MTRGETAKNYFLSGLNCSQSVVLAFKDIINIDEEALKGLSVGFGGGLARQRLTCGTVSGMAMVLSYVYRDKSKAEVYAIIQKACEKFKEETGSLVCGELLSGVKATVGGTPDERTKEYYKKRPCADLCQLSADITEQTIEENQ